MSGPNPWEPLIELLRLGCVPIGYARIDGETAFTVYVPDHTRAAKAKET